MCQETVRKGGGSGGSSKRASCPALSYSVVSLEGAVRYGGSNLQHNMRSPRRPAHLLIRAHPAMKQPLHGAFGRRRRYWLRVVTRRRIVDDQFRLPGHVRLKTTQEFSHLARGRTRRRRHGGRVDGVERFRCISIRSSARCTWPCHRRQRTCSTSSAKRAPSWRSSFLLPGQPLTA
jgi:hypothetical protein